MAQCKYCKKDHFKLHKIDDIQMRSGFRWELYDPVSENYHDQNRCRVIEQKRKEAQEKKEQEDKLIARIIHKRKDYVTTSFFDKPKEQPTFTKKMCSCPEDQIYPTRIEKPIYFFSTTKLMRTDYIYWCSYCGYYLTREQIEKHFNEYVKTWSS